MHFEKGPNRVRPKSVGPVNFRQRFFKGLKRPTHGFVFFDNLTSVGLMLMFHVDHNDLRTSSSEIRQGWVLGYLLIFHDGGFGVLFRLIHLIIL